MRQGCTNCYNQIKDLDLERLLFEKIIKLAYEEFDDFFALSSFKLVISCDVKHK